MTGRTAREETGSFGELWRRPYLSRTVMLVIFQALQTIGFYGFANWAPTFLLKRGVSLLHSLEYTMLIALVSPVGPLLAAWTSDRMERKWTIVVLALTGGWTWNWIWEFDCARGGRGIWGAFDAGELLVFGGVSCVSGGIVSNAIAGDGRGVHV